MRFECASLVQHPSIGYQRVLVDKGGPHGLISYLCTSKAVLEEINQNEGISPRRR